MLNISYWIDTEREKFLPEYLVASKGAAFIDIGAHTGFWSIHMAKKGVKVYSFEPNPTTFKILEENTKQYENVKIYNIALGDREEIKPLYLHQLAGEDSLRLHVTGYTGTWIDIQVKLLDSFKFTEKIDLVKIDTEGYENNVLNGARKTIEMHSPRLIVEVHQGRRELKEEIKVITDILDELRYTYFIKLKYQTRQPMIIADCIGVRI